MAYIYSEALANSRLTVARLPMFTCFVLGGGFVNREKFMQVGFNPKCDKNNFIAFLWISLFYAALSVYMVFL